MNAPEKITALLKPTAEGLGYEWVGTEVLSQTNGSLLRIYLDKPGGITLDDCVTAGQQMVAVLTVEKLNHLYRIEVSSPGLDRPLFEKKHWEQALGKEVKVKLNQPIDGHRQMRGLIKTVGDDAVMLHCASEEFKVPLSCVNKANLVAEVDFKRSKKRQ